MADTTDAKEQTPAGPAIAAVAGASDGMIGGAGCSARARGCAMLKAGLSTDDSAAVRRARAGMRGPTRTTTWRCS